MSLSKQKTKRVFQKIIEEAGGEVVEIIPNYPHIHFVIRARNGDEIKWAMPTIKSDVCRGLKNYRASLRRLVREGRKAQEGRGSPIA